MFSIIKEMGAVKGLVPRNPTGPRMVLGGEKILAFLLRPLTSGSPCECVSFCVRGDKDSPWGCWLGFVRSCPWKAPETSSEGPVASEPPCPKLMASGEQSLSVLEMSLTSLL